MLLRLFRRLAHDREFQVAADDGSDVLERHALLRDRVKRAAGSAAFEREPVDPRRVEPMPGRPTIEPFTGLEYSSFAVDGRADLTMVVHNPATPADVERIRSLLEAQATSSLLACDRANER